MSVECGVLGLCLFVFDLDNMVYNVYNLYNDYKLCHLQEEIAVERTIGTTELRQRLTDVLQTVREQRDSYSIETFDRSQAALVNLEEYRQFQRFRREREGFFEWLEDTAARNAGQNRGLSDEEVLAIIAQAREEVSTGVE